MASDFRKVYERIVHPDRYLVNTLAFGEGEVEVTRTSQQDFSSLITAPSGEDEFVISLTAKKVYDPPEYDQPFFLTLEKIIKYVLSWFIRLPEPLPFEEQKMSVSMRLLVGKEQNSTIELEGRIYGLQGSSKSSFQDLFKEAQEKCPSSQQKKSPTVIKSAVLIDLEIAPEKRKSVEIIGSAVKVFILKRLSLYTEQQKFFGKLNVRLPKKPQKIVLHKKPFNISLEAFKKFDKEFYVIAFFRGVQQLNSTLETRVPTSQAITKLSGSRFASVEEHGIEGEKGSLSGNKYNQNITTTMVETVMPVTPPWQPDQYRATHEAFIEAFEKRIGRKWDDVISELKAKQDSTELEKKLLSFFELPASWESETTSSESSSWASYNPLNMVIWVTDTLSSYLLNSWEVRRYYAMLTSLRELTNDPTYLHSFNNTPEEKDKYAVELIHALAFCRYAGVMIYPTMKKVVDAWLESGKKNSPPSPSKTLITPNNPAPLSSESIMHCAAHKENDPHAVREERDESNWNIIVKKSLYSDETSLSKIPCQICSVTRVEKPNNSKLSNRDVSSTANADATLGTSSWDVTVGKGRGTAGYGFDPNMQWNVPTVLADVELLKKDGAPKIVRLLRMGCPTMQGYTEGTPTVVPEFKAYLASCRAAGRKHLYVSLQRAFSDGGSELLRTKALLGLQSEFPDTFFVVAMDKDTTFYDKQPEELMEYPEFKQQFEERLFGKTEETGYYFPSSWIADTEFKRRLSTLMDQLHCLVYYEKSAFPRQKYNDDRESPSCNKESYLRDQAMLKNTNFSEIYKNERALSKEGYAAYAKTIFLSPEQCNKYLENTHLDSGQRKDFHRLTEQEYQYYRSRLYFTKEEREDFIVLFEAFIIPYLIQYNEFDTVNCTCKDAIDRAMELYAVFLTLVQLMQGKESDEEIDTLIKVLTLHASIFVKTQPMVQHRAERMLRALARLRDPLVVNRFRKFAEGTNTGVNPNAERGIFPPDSALLKKG